MGRTSRIVALAAGVLASVVLGGAPAGAAVPLRLQGPEGIAAGTDGNVWFTEPGSCEPLRCIGGNRIGRITPSGAINEYSVGLSRASGLGTIAAGPDGNMWFTEIIGNRIGRITPTGVITEFSAGISPASRPAGVAAGADGNLWFTETGTCEQKCVGGNRLGRITPAGVVTEFSTGLSPETAPFFITAGPDGNMWFTEIIGNRIGRITPAGVITEFSTGLSPGGMLVGITAGPDGNLWFTEPTTCDEVCIVAGRIGRITPAGVITEFPMHLSDGMPSIITAGPDGNLWFTNFDGRGIGRITPGGVITAFSKGLSPNSQPLGIVGGPDGNVWFTEQLGNRIGRITTAGVISEFPRTAQILRARQVGMRVTVRLRCPVGATLPCKGTVRLGKTGNGGTRRLPPLAAGRSTTVVIPISAKWRRQLFAGRRLNVTLLLLPEAHSMAGALAQPITLRSATRPRIPAVAG